MKIRTDFVSNSSSSSFIVICDTNKENPLEKYPNIQLIYSEYNPLMLPSDEYGGQCSFGWEFKKYSSFWSKLNWCAILITQMEIYVNMPEEDKKWYTESEYSKKIYEQRLAFATEHFEEYKNMLIDVCKSEFNLHIDVLSYNEADKIYAYIDHQSDIFENPENARMFESSYTLIDFLTSIDSYIRTGNDNSYPPDDWDDCEDESEIIF
jgi:hypothetical protein